MTKDFEITVKVRNNKLLSKMRESGIETIAELARRMGFKSSGSVNAIATMALPGRGKIDGKWRPLVLKVAEFLGCNPEDIVPESVRDHPMQRTTAKFTADIADIGAIANNLKTMALPADVHLDKVDMINTLNQKLATLTPRKERMLRMRFGLGCEEMTLEQISQEFGISKGRTQQIVEQALRQMRHPVRVDGLREIMYDLSKDSE